MELNKKIFRLENILIFSTVIIITFGVIIRTKLLFLNPSFWFDTYALADNLDNSYNELFKPLSCMQVAPPFFLIVSKFLYNTFYTGGSIETKDFIIRLTPYVCGILSLPLFSILLHKAFKNSLFTLVGTFLLSFNICAINYTIEYKQYSCEMLCSIILLLLFYSINKNDNSIKKSIYYSIAFTIIPWFSNSAWIILFCGLIYLIADFVVKKQKNYTTLLILIIPFLINLLVFYTQFYYPIHNQTYAFMHKYWGIAIPSFFNSEDFINTFPQKVNDLIPLFSDKLFWIFIWTNIFFLFFGENKKNIFFILFPISITIIASFFEMYPFQNRLILFLLPCFIMLYIQCLSIVKDKKLLNFIIIFFVLILSTNNLILPSEIYITHKSITRDLFYILKKQNPELKNVITHTSVFAYQSNRIEYYYDNMFNPFQRSKIPVYIKTLPRDKYWIYVPFGDKKYIDNLLLFLNSNKTIKNIQYYYPPQKNWKPVGTEKQAFIAEIEL